MHRLSRLKVDKRCLMIIVSLVLHLYFNHILHIHPILDHLHWMLLNACMTVHVLWH